MAARPRMRTWAPGAIAGDTRVGDDTEEGDANGTPSLVLARRWRCSGWNDIGDGLDWLHDTLCGPFSSQVLPREAPREGD